MKNTTFSSQQNDALTAKPIRPKLGADGPITCHNCGREKMILKFGDCDMSDGVVVPKVEYLECEACGERLFDGQNTDKVVRYRRSQEKTPVRPKAIAGE